MRKLRFREVIMSRVKQLVSCGARIGTLAAGSMTFVSIKLTLLLATLITE